MCEIIVERSKLNVDKRGTAISICTTLSIDLIGQPAGSISSWSR
jgi:hypothetical protein